MLWFGWWLRCTSCCVSFDVVVGGASTGAVFEQGYMLVVVVSSADGQTVQKTCGIPQVQFLDKLFMPVVGVWCQWPDSAENCSYAAVAVIRHEVLKTVEVPQCSSLTWVVLFMDKVVDCRHCARVWRAGEYPWKFHRCSSGDKVFTPVVARRCGGPDVQETV